MPRHDGRSPDQIRPLEIVRAFTSKSPGSVLYRCGDTHVLVTASIEERVPRWMAGRGRGWVTAEYAMLPGATGDRRARERSQGRVDGRTQEIQRLIGRALRAVVDMRAIGERTIWLDCDVIQADGGTRTASVNAAYVALCDALRNYTFKKPLDRWPITEPIGAISVGVVKGEALADLDYIEDSGADVDMNVIMTASGKLIEVQGTAEKEPFSRDELNTMLDLAQGGITQALEAARVALAQPLGQ